MNATDMENVVKFIDAAFKLAVQIQGVSGPKLVDFKKACGEPGWVSKISGLKEEVEAFANKFMLPGQPIL